MLSGKKSFVRHAAKSGSRISNIPQCTSFCRQSKATFQMPKNLSIVSNEQLDYPAYTTIPWYVAPSLRWHRPLPMPWHCLKPGLLGQRTHTLYLYIRTSTTTTKKTTLVSVCNRNLEFIRIYSSIESVILNILNNCRGQTAFDIYNQTSLHVSWVRVFSAVV